MRQKSLGFTLIELMVTVAVVAILLGLGVPSLQSFVVNNRLVGVTNDLMTALSLARSEAMRRATPAVVCPSSNDTSCTGSWSDGWIVFVDDDGDGTVDADELQRVFPGPPSGYTVNADDAVAASVTYDRLGATDITAVAYLYICHGGDTDTARGIEIRRLRPRIDRAIAQCEKDD